MGSPKRPNRKHSCSVSSLHRKRKPGSSSCLKAMRLRECKNAVEFESTLLGGNDQINQIHTDLCWHSQPNYFIHEPQKPSSKFYLEPRYPSLTPKSLKFIYLSVHVQNGLFSIEDAISSASQSDLRDVPFAFCTLSCQVISYRTSRSARRAFHVITVDTLHFTLKVVSQCL